MTYPRLLCVTFWTLPVRRTGPIEGRLEDCDPGEGFLCAHEGWPWLVDDDGALHDVHLAPC